MLKMYKRICHCDIIIKQVYQNYQIEATLLLLITQMEAIDTHITQLTNSINQNCKDMSLVTQLQSSINQLTPTLPSYTKLIFAIYDLSNHHNLITITDSIKLHSHPLSLRLKCQALRMICHVLTLIINKEMQVENYKRIELQAFEIMSLSIRVLIEEEGSVGLGAICEFQGYSDRLFELIENLGKAEGSIVSIYFMNKLDIMRINVDSSSFVLKDFLRTVKNWEALHSRFQRDPSTDQYVKCLVTEVVLKILRKGQHVPSIISELLQYVPVCYRDPITKIINSQSLSEECVEILGPDYQLYWQIKTHGISNISEEYLEKILGDMYENNNSAIFQIILLSNQPILLALWFSTANRSLKKATNTLQAYQCFSALIQKSPANLDVLLQLTREVCLSVLREPKNSSKYFQCLLSNITRFILHLGSSQSSYKKEVLELFESIYLAASKHGVTSICKTVSSLHLYFQMLNQNVTNPKKLEETYKKFMKHFSSDRSEMTKLLKAAYQIITNSNTQVDSSLLEMLNKRPEFAIMFLDNQNKLLLLLNIPVQQIQKMANPFAIFISLLSQQYLHPNDLLRVGNYFMQFLNKASFKNLPCNAQTILSLKQICRQLTATTEYDIFCIIWLYLHCLASDSHKVMNYDYGQQYNNYTKIMKMQSLIEVDAETIEIMKIIICRSCIKLKKCLTSLEKFESGVEVEAGQINFLKLIYEKMLEYWKHCLVEEDRNAQEFLKFSMFQILCISNKQNEAEEFLRENQEPTMLKLCLSSVHLPKNLKRFILRKLFKLNLTQKIYPVVTLEEMRDLVDLAESTSQGMIYIRAMVEIFGERGMTYLELASRQNKKISALLLNIDKED